jgi:protein-disulfide isomerase-like protein with CxxC motif
MKHETAAKAAKWWTSKLRRGGTNAGLDGENGAYAVLLGVLLQSSAMSKNTPDKLANFETKLTAHFEAIDRDWYVIGTDYGPEGDLADIAHAAGIDGSAFPWKTRMYFKGDAVTVAEGYGAPDVNI